ncbi:MAG: BBP7 family outer membrane beta-barrel protein [Planctomycetaceae bacterium]
MPGIHVPRSGYQAPVIDYYSGQPPQLWDDQQPVEHFLGELGKRSWLRLDYIHWSFESADSQNIGAPVTNLIPPLNVTSTQAGSGAFGVATIPNASGLSLNDTPGARGTWGLDLTNAEFELEFFGTGQNDSSFSITNISGFRPATATGIGTEERPNVVIPLRSSGAVVDADTANYLLFDDSFTAGLRGQMWGTEASLLTKRYIPGDGLGLQWLGGFRYLSYDEEFSAQGTFNNGGLIANEVTRIQANTTNQMYGPEVGFRTSVNHRWFTFSATPRIAFTLNDHSAATAFNGVSVGSGSEVDFTPIVQVSFVGELHLTPNFSVFGGYDMMWIYRLTRPYDNVVYDSSPGLAGAFNTDISQAIDLNSFSAEGLSIGCVFRY